MAYDKVVDSAFLEAGLTLVGDSIRAKGGTSAKLEFPNGMKAAVEAIDTSEDLDEVLDEQDSIIDQIQAALEGKAAASVETCTISFTGGNTFVFSGQTPDGIVNSSEHPSGSSVTVIKGTMFYVSVKNMSLSAYVADGSCTGVITRTGQELVWTTTGYPSVFAYATGDVTFYANVD